jgi:hypothetical protein
MIFSIDKLAGVDNYLVYKNFLEKIDFPKESMELIDAMGWVQNYSSNKEKALFSKLFSDWRTCVGMEPLEVEKFEEVFEIVNSSIILRSFYIDSSSRVRDSENVSKSKYVAFSKDIKNSKRVYSSINVENSQYINASPNVLGSAEVDDSSKIQYSQNVFNSDEISNCYGVYFCRKVENSLGVFNISTGKEIYFSTDLENCSYCLFCSGLKDKSFCLFNQEIGLKDWFVIKELLLNEWSEEDKSLYKVVSFENDNNEWCGFRYLSKTNASFSYVAQRNFFQGLSSKFLKYICSMPYYNEWLLYQITMNPKILEE